MKISWGIQIKRKRIWLSQTTSLRIKSFSWETCKYLFRAKREAFWASISQSSIGFDVKRSSYSRTQNAVFKTNIDCWSFSFKNLIFWGVRAKISNSFWVRIREITDQGWNHSKAVIRNWKIAFCLRDLIV